MKRTSKTETNQADLPRPIFKATSDTTPVYAYNYVTWEDAMYMANVLYNKAENNVTSRIINLRGWGAALEFIETVGEDNDIVYPLCAVRKSWFRENVSKNSNHEIGKTIDYLNKTKLNKLKNIYDMAGNVNEWSALANKYNRSNCASLGGSFKDSEITSANYVKDDGYKLGEDKGFRIAIYL